MDSTASTKDQIQQRMRNESILTLMRDSFPKLFTLSDLQTELPEPIESHLLIKHIRQNLHLGTIRLITGEDGKNYYKGVPIPLIGKFEGLSESHHKVYNIIEQSGNLGIWRRNIKRKAFLEERQVSSIIKDLENKLLIKSVTSMNDKKIKVFMTYDTLPSADVTGGVWYNDGVFNSSFVDTLLPYISQYISVNSPPGVEFSDLKKYIIQCHVGNVVLAEDDAEQVIRAVVNTGKAEFSGSKVVCVEYISPIDPVSRIPCRGCPVANICAPNCPVNPVECPYLTKFSEFM